MKTLKTHVKEGFFDNVAPEAVEETVRAWAKKFNSLFPASSIEIKGNYVIMQSSQETNIIPVSFHGI